MTVKAMTYLWLKYLEEVDKKLVTTDLPDTETIVKFLDTAQTRYLKTRYLSGKDIKTTVAVIMKATDELRNIIKRTTLTPVSYSGTTNSYTDYVSYVSLSSLTDYLHYIRADVKVTRTAAITISSTHVPCELMDYGDVDTYLSNPYNYPIIMYPRIIFQEDDLMDIIYDADTSITAGASMNLTYLRNPKKLIDEYTKTECYSTTTTGTIGEVYIVTGGTVIYNALSYISGETFTIVSGVLSIPFTNTNTGCLLGDYTTETQECELAEYTHEEIVRLALAMYLDELKFKLIQKQQPKQ